MDKLQGKAKVLSIDTEALKDYNKSNNTQKIVILFAYADGSNDDDNDQLLLESLSHNVTKRCIVDLTTFEGANFQKKVSSFEERFAFENCKKLFTFTTFIAQISELNDNGIERVKNVQTDAEYSSFSKNYIGKYNDADAALKSMKKSFAKRLDEGDIEAVEE